MQKKYHCSASGNLYPTSGLGKQSPMSQSAYRLYLESIAYSVGYRSDNTLSLPYRLRGEFLFFFLQFLCRIRQESVLRGFYQNWGIFINMKTKCKCGNNDFVVYESLTHSGQFDEETGVMHCSSEEPDGIKKIICTKCNRRQSLSIELEFN